MATEPWATTAIRFRSAIAGPSWPISALYSSATMPPSTMSLLTVAMNWSKRSRPPEDSHDHRVQHLSRTRRRPETALQTDAGRGHPARHRLHHWRVPEPGRFLPVLLDGLLVLARAGFRRHGSRDDAISHRRSLGHHDPPPSRSGGPHHAVPRAPVHPDRLRDSRPLRLGPSESGGGRICAETSRELSEHADVYRAIHHLLRYLDRVCLASEPVVRATGSGGQCRCEGQSRKTLGPAQRPRPHPLRVYRDVFLHRLGGVARNRLVLHHLGISFRRASGLNSICLCHRGLGALSQTGTLRQPRQGGALSRLGQAAADLR